MLLGHRKVMATFTVLTTLGLFAAWGCGGGSEQSEDASAAVGRSVSQGDAARDAEAGKPLATDVEKAMATDDRAAPAAPPDGARPPEVAGARGVARVLENAPQYPRPELPPAAERQSPPALELVDMSGRTVKLEDLRGQVVLLAFWATWCRPCIMEIPHLVHLTKTYAEAGFKVVGISVDRNGIAAVKPFIEQRSEINYTVIPNGTAAAMAFGGIRSIPTSILLDRKGRIVRAFVGLQPPEVLEGTVQAALRETL